MERGKQIMTIATEPEIEFRPQLYYWSKLGQLKYDLILYGKYFSECVFWLRCFRIGSALLTSLTTGALIGWSDIAWIRVTCPILIFILQAINAGAEFLPFENRKLELRELIDALEPLYDKMEYDWQMIALGNFTLEEIESKTLEYQTRKTEICKHFLKNDALPERKKLSNKVKTETDIYFSNMQ